MRTFLGGSIAIASFCGIEICTGFAESCLLLLPPSLFIDRRNCVNLYQRPSRLLVIALPCPGPTFISALARTATPHYYFNDSYCESVLVCSAALRFQSVPVDFQPLPLWQSPVARGPNALVPARYAAPRVPQTKRNPWQCRCRFESVANKAVIAQLLRLHNILRLDWRRAIVNSVKAGVTGVVLPPLSRRKLTRASRESG